MRIKKRLFPLSFLLEFFTISSCNDEQEELPGGPPIANAGPDLAAITESAVTLDGIASADPEGDELNYSWCLTTIPGDQIIFNSNTRDGNCNWSVIPAHINNHFAYTKISYGGNKSNLIYFSGSNRPANLALARGASLNVSNSSVTNSKGYGIAVHPEAEIISGDNLHFSNNILEDSFPKISAQ